MKLGGTREFERSKVLPAPPPKPFRRLAWKKADLLVLHASPLEDAGPRIAQLAWLPVRDGRIEMSGARRMKVSLSGSIPSWDAVGDAAGPEEAEIPIADRPEDAPGLALDRRFLITWSAQELVPLLDEVFGGGPKQWFRRTIDVQRLTSAADRLAGDASDPDLNLASVARRHHVPGRPPFDALDAALMTAELFLVLATRLAAQGHRDVGSLLLP